MSLVWPLLASPLPIVRRALFLLITLLLADDSIAASPNA